MDDDIVETSHCTTLHGFRGSTEGQSRSPQSRFQTLCNDVVDDVAVNVGEAEVATGVTMRQLGVIES